MEKANVHHNIKPTSVAPLIVIPSFPSSNELSRVPREFTTSSPPLTSGASLAQLIVSTHSGTSRSYIGSPRHGSSPAQRMPDPSHSYRRLCSVASWMCTLASGLTMLFVPGYVSTSRQRQHRRAGVLKKQICQPRERQPRRSGRSAYA